MRICATKHTSLNVFVAVLFGDTHPLLCCYGDCCSRAIWVYITVKMLKSAPVWAVEIYISVIMDTSPFHLTVGCFFFFIFQYSSVCLKRIRCIAGAHAAGPRL